MANAGENTLATSGFEFRPAGRKADREFSPHLSPSPIWEAPQGRDVITQGEALGHVTRNGTSPERANSMNETEQNDVPPLQG